MKNLIMVLIGLALLLMFGLVGHIEQKDQSQMNQDQTQQFDPHSLSN